MTNANRENSILRFQPFQPVTSANTDIEMRVDKKAIKNLSSKQGAGTRDEAPLTILCPLLKRLDYCTLWACLFNVVSHLLKCP